jgi:hypothetical protein
MNEAMDVTASPTEGAKIACVRCGARPWPELALPEIVRQTFDLLRLDDQARPAESPAPGNWHCERHYKSLGGGKYRIIADE